VGGVRLPQDALAGVAVRGFIPYGGYIQAGSIQALAAGSLARGNGQVVTGAAAGRVDMQNLLAPGTVIAPTTVPSETFRVPFSADPTQQLGLFFSTAAIGGSFDPANIVFTVQDAVVANAAGSGNVVIPSNAARGADVALVTVVPTYGNNNQRQGTQVQSINISGDGASISTSQWIAGEIRSTGPMGDIALFSNQNVGKISAPSFIGSITLGGEVTGTIQSTGQRTDPITGVTTSVPADIGRVFVDASGHLATTTISISGGIFGGRVVSRGNLVSQFSTNIGAGGVLAVQGNLGTAFGSSRLGGFTNAGNLAGDVVVLGRVIGDLAVTGGLVGSGRIAAKGGFSGNVSISGGIDTGAALVSDGGIGDPSLGTTLSVSGKVKGIIAAKGSINFLGSPLTGPTIFNNASVNSPPSAAAIDAIFNDSMGNPLAFDVSNLDLSGLSTIRTQLSALHVGRNGQLTLVPGA
jgi:hypothetical protein